MYSKNKVLGAYALAMMAVVAIIDLRGVPLMASYGLASVFLYVIAALFFLIPSALVCAELTTSFPQAGGLYAWIGKAFGGNTGFFAIWLEWINNVVSFPASLTFIAVTLTYLYQPQLAQNKHFILGATLFILWGVTLFTCLGIKASSRLNTLGALFGTIIPAIAIILLSGAWLLSGHHSQINFSWHLVLPNFHSGNLAFFTSTLLGYAGMQVIAFHISNVYEPQKDYPKAILLAVIIILAVTIGAALAIAMVVPVNQLNVVSGLMDSFSYFFVAFHLMWVTPVLAALIVLSVLATLNTWFMGPARGLAVAAKDNYFFPSFAYTNRAEAPVRILFLQAIIASLFLLIFIYMPSISGGFWVLLNLSAQSTLIMYILLFASAVKLRYSNEVRANNAYRIPANRAVMTVFAGLGILTCLIALAVSLIPPASINTGSLWHYEFILISSNIVFLSIPVLLILRKMKQAVGLAATSTHYT